MGNIHTVEEMKRSVAWLRCRASDRCEEYAEAEDDYHDVADQMDGLLSRCASLEALVRELAVALRTIKDYPVRDAMDVGFVHGRYARHELESCISGMRNEAAYAISNHLVSELTGEKG